MMLVSLYAVQLEHEQRLKDAERRRKHESLIRDATEQAPVVVYYSLWDQIKRRMQHVQQPQKQVVRDARRATAV